MSSQQRQQRSNKEQWRRGQIESVKLLSKTQVSQVNIQSYKGDTSWSQQKYYSGCRYRTGYVME